MYTACTCANINVCTLHVYVNVHVCIMLHVNVCKCEESHMCKTCTTNFNKDKLKFIVFILTTLVSRIVNVLRLRKMDNCEVLNSVT